MSKVEELIQRYHSAVHAMQSGVAMEITIDAGSVEPKHLRVGVNSAMCNDAAIARLLIKKGIIDEEEYYQEVAEEAEREVKRYEERLSVMMGTKITLA